MTTLGCQGLRFDNVQVNGSWMEGPEETDVWSVFERARRFIGGGFHDIMMG